MKCEVHLHGPPGPNAAGQGPVNRVLAAATVSPSTEAPQAAPATIIAAATWLLNAASAGSRPAL